MTWDKSPASFIDEFEKELHNKTSKAVLTAFNNVVALSPVDTGKFRRSHHISVGSPSYAQNGSTSLTLRVGQYVPIFIQTNLPYCIRIENGWSKQAPSGVYQNAFNSMVASLG